MPPPFAVADGIILKNPPGVSIHLSVILCTHNPRPAILARVLRALEEQTLARSAWELLIIDNGSTEPLHAGNTVAWHPRGRVLVETTLGLSRARISGIVATEGALLVFVDDDNVLAPNYLERALGVAHERPYLGAWGGAVVGEFETPPPSWAKPYLPFLALRNPTRESWSNATQITDATPCGAGLCVRRPVAAAWTERTRHDQARLSLGRIGRGLGAGEDGDLAFTACDLGLGAGVFPHLRLTHIIPAERLSLEYLERLVEDMSRSEVVLRSLRQTVTPSPHHGLAARAFHAYSLLRMPAPTRRLMRAGDRGRRSGHMAVLAAQSLHDASAR